MQIYLSLKDVPELSPLSAAERERVWKKAYARLMRDWKSWLALPITCFCGCSIVFLGYTRVTIPLAGAISGFLYWEAMVYLARPHIRKTQAAIQTPSP